MRRVRRSSRKSQQANTPALPLDDGTLATPGGLAMIQALIPLGLRAVEEALQQEVLALAGPRYARDDARPDVVRWGHQAGSVFLADQKLPMQVPRVRDRASGHELPLATYAQFQTPRAQDAGLYHRVLAGISCREYASAAEAVPEAFGLAKSSVSRRFVRASAGELRRLMERRHDDAEWLVLVLDGKAFAGDQVVVALGVTATGEKRVLGLVQTASENRRVLASFLRELGERGFPLDRPLLVERARCCAGPVDCPSGQVRETIQATMLMNRLGIETAAELVETSKGELSEGTCYRIVAADGEVADCSADTIEALCDIFSVDVGDLFERSARRTAQRGDDPRQRGYAPLCKQAPNRVCQPTLQSSS